MKKVYIAGPMTGLPDYNYPAFNEAGQQLVARGYVVENPAQNAEPPCKSWLGYMRMALPQMVGCDVVALLPGWHTSRGAGIERQLALDLGLRVVDLSALLNGDFHA
jgi:hypothetical protein